jgi:hypothetical protein
MNLRTVLKIELEHGQKEYKVFDPENVPFLTRMAGSPKCQDMS